MIWAASCCRAGGSSPRCRHPSRRRRLVRPAFDGFRAIDDRAATTRPGYWPSGLVMLHHPIDEKFNKQNKQPKHWNHNGDIFFDELIQYVNAQRGLARRSGRYESARCNDGPEWLHPGRYILWQTPPTDSHGSSFSPLLSHLLLLLLSYYIIFLFFFSHPDGFRKKRNSSSSPFQQLLFLLSSLRSKSIRVIRKESIFTTGRPTHAQFARFQNGVHCFAANSESRNAEKLFFLSFPVTLKWFLWMREDQLTRAEPCSFFRFTFFHSSHLSM